MPCQFRLRHNSIAINVEGKADLGRGKYIRPFKRYREAPSTEKRIDCYIDLLHGYEFNEVMLNCYKNILFELEYLFLFTSSSTE